MEKFKKIILKISDILLSIFSIGILCCLLAGGVSFVLYIIALIGGGEFATTLCTWTFKTYLPIVIVVTSIITGIGLLGMYLSKQKSLVISQDDKKENKNG